MKRLLYISSLSLFSLLSGLILQAQDNAMPHQDNSSASHPQPDSVIKLIPVEVGRHISYLYSVGGKLQTPEDIRARVLNYAPSADEYRLARRNFTWSYVLFAGLGASMIGATVEYAANNRHAGETVGLVNGQPGFIYQQHSLTAAYVLTGAATGFLISSVITYVSGRQHSRKALQLYNRRFE